MPMRRKNVDPLSAKWPQDKIFLANETIILKLFQIALNAKFAQTKSKNLLSTTKLYRFSDAPASFCALHVNRPTSFRLAAVICRWRPPAKIYKKRCAVNPSD